MVDVLIINGINCRKIGDILSEDGCCIMYAQDIVTVFEQINNKIPRSHNIRHGTGD